MKRNLKALGLALGAMLVIGTVGAVGAQANEEGHFVSAFETGEHTSSFVTGTDEFEANPLEFTSEGGSVSCDVNEFHGGIEGGTTKELTLETTFGGELASQNCTASEFPTTVFNNGCHLSLKTVETTEQTTVHIGEWKVTADFHCPEGQPGKVLKVYAGGSHGFQVCQIVTPPQTDLEGITIHNNVTTPSAPHDLTLTFEVAGIHQTQSGLCGSAEGEDELHGEVTLTATNVGEEEPIDLYVEHIE